MIATKERLAQILHAEGLFEMEKAARAGLYDDFESDSATPIVDLVRDLRAGGKNNLAARAMNGEWETRRKKPMRGIRERERI